MPTGENLISKRILIIDDNPDVRQVLELTLSRAGYGVETASQGKAGLEKARDTSPDLILLDIMLPDIDGWQVCRRLREITDVPIVMLTVLSGAEETIKGLSLGADDYIAKPWSIRELLARIQAALRRASTSPATTRQQTYSCGDLVIDPLQREVIIGERKVHLTPIEFRLLSYLARRAGQVVPYDELIAQIWGSGIEHDVDSLRWHMHNLRQKIETDPRRPRYLLAKYGRGYCLANQPQPGRWPRTRS